MALVRIIIQLKGVGHLLFTARPISEQITLNWSKIISGVVKLMCIPTARWGARAYDAEHKHRGSNPCGFRYEVRVPCPSDDGGDGSAGMIGYRDREGGDRVDDAWGYCRRSA